MKDFVTKAASALAVLVLGVGAPGLAPAAFARETIPLRAGARYVAMGSSFASGSGIAPYDPAAPARCQRSSRNYARQLAHKRKLTLVDVTCGGATTAHMTGRWGELPAQADALTPDTALVTITIGGNDIGYIGGLIAGSCDGAKSPGAADQPLCRMIAAGRRSGAAMPSATPGAWEKLEAALDSLAKDVRRRAPAARIVFVDYLAVLPEGALCARAPLSPEAAAQGRETAARLARLTAHVAKRNGADVLAASALSQGRHDACAKVPWMAGFVAPDASPAFVPYHPNLAGMTAIADALDRKLGR